MKAAKWLKWKIGAITTVLLVLVFQFIKSSPHYQLQVDKQAASKAAPDQTDLRSDAEDDVMREWQEQAPPSSDGSQQSERPRGRHFARGGDRFDSQTGQNGNDYDTRTTRS